MRTNGLVVNEKGYDFSEEEYDKELDELQEDEKPEKRKRRA